MKEITVRLISILVVCKACLFTAVSSEVFDLFDHCK